MLVSLSLLVAWGCICSPIKLHRLSSSSRKAHPYMRSQESLLCLKSLEETPGDPAVAQGELDRAVEGHQSSSRTGICFFVWGRTEDCQSPTKWPPAGYKCACFWPNCQKQTPWGWHEGPTTSSGTCAHSPATCISIGLCQRTPELAGPPLAPHSLHRWEPVHTEHMWKSLEKLLCCL